MWARITKYLSPKQLITGLLTHYIPILISLLIGGGALLASISSSTSHWFWSDARISNGGALLFLLAALSTSGTLAVYLRREWHSGREWGGAFNLDRMRLDAADRGVLKLLALFDGEPMKIQAIQEAFQMGNLEVKAVLNKLHGLDIVKVMPGDYVDLTMYGIECARQNNLLPKPDGPDKLTRLRELQGVVPVTPEAQSAPMELTDSEVAVLQCLGNVWRPGTSVSVQWCAVVLKLSALQVSTVFDALSSKGLVDNGVPGAISLTEEGRALCVERGWHGALEAYRREHPRAP